MHYLETDPGSNAKLKAANAIPVNAEIGMAGCAIDSRLCSRSTCPRRSAAVRTVRFTASSWIFNYPMALRFG